MFLTVQSETAPMLSRVDESDSHDMDSGIQSDTKIFRFPQRGCCPRDGGTCSRFWRRRHGEGSSENKKVPFRHRHSAAMWRRNVQNISSSSSVRKRKKEDGSTRPVSRRVTPKMWNRCGLPRNLRHENQHRIWQPSLVRRGFSVGGAAIRPGS